MKSRLLVAGLAVALAVVACSSSRGTPSSAPAGPTYDNDTARLADCDFQASPSQPTKPAPSPGPIQAGIGSAVLALPIGTPFGGYTERSKALGNDPPADARAWRWSTDFNPSVGVYDAPKVEALALEVGGEKWVLIRMDAALVTTPAIYAVEDAIAPDGSMRGRVTLSASHSHSAWAAWQPTYWLLPGVDRPREDLFDRVVATIASAAQQALGSLQPARIGFAQDTHFDPNDTVSHDRRPENDHVLGPDGNTAGKNKDPNVWAMRVDEADGTPLAAVVDVALHGTIGDDPNLVATTDAPGAVARALSAQLGYPVLHLQGATGDIAPSGPTGRGACPDPTRCLDIPRMEIVGAAAAALVAPMVQGIKTDAQAVMEVVSRPSYVGHAAVVHRPYTGQTLYYTVPTEDYVPDGIILGPDGWIASPIDEFDAPSGAGLCGTPGQGSVAPIPGTHGMGPYPSCLSLSKGGSIVWGIFDMPDVDLPLCTSARLTTTAVRFSGLSSGDWLMLGAPGEPTAPFASYLRGRSPAGRDHTLLFGYADYGGYLLTAEDWLAGGYETTINVWGPLEGETILDDLLDTAAIAWTPAIEDPQAGATRYTGWQWPGDTPVAVTTTSDQGTPAPATDMFWLDTADPSTSGQPPAIVSRAVGVARFTWYGGDPAVDFPEVNVEVYDGSKFVPLTDSRGNPASSYDGAAVLTYAPEPLTAKNPAHHVYAATWQAVPPDPFSLYDATRPFSLPTGVYRLHAHGQAQAANGVRPYDVASSAFVVQPAPLGTTSTATRSGGALAVTAEVDSPSGLRALRDGQSDGPVPLPGPWSVRVTMDDGTTQGAQVATDGAGHATVSVAGAGAAHAVSVEVSDAWGNGGTLGVT